MRPSPAKDTHIGAGGMRFGRGHLPLVNIWYGKAALDHMLLHAAQENLVSGYRPARNQSPEGMETRLLVGAC